MSISAAKRVIAPKHVPYLPLLANLWKSYITSVSPRAGEVYLYLTEDLQLNVVTDQISLRTVSHPTVSIEKLGASFELFGWKAIKDHFDSDQHITIKEYEHEDNNLGDFAAPKIVISELELGQMSDFARDTLTSQAERIPVKTVQCWDLLTYGVPHSTEGAPNYQVYNRLRDESEFSAWCYIYGWVPHDFTISLLHLWKLNDKNKKRLTLEEFTKFIEGDQECLNEQQQSSFPNGHLLLRGTPRCSAQLRMSSAELRPVRFSDGQSRRIPSC